MFKNINSIILSLALITGSAAAQQDAASTCETAFSNVCLPASESSKEDCVECVQANFADLRSAGCTNRAFKKFCKPLSVKKPVPETVLPEGATDSNPLRVFFQAGQSGCVGQSSMQDFMQDSNPSYDELKGQQEGVWFAGLHAGGKYQEAGNGADGSRFFMKQMVAGEESRNGQFFGPDVALGRRLADADENSAPVLIVKYCWGGSNVDTEWNPDADANSWDRNADEKTALWLLDNAADLTSKNHLYVNFIYTARRSLELLDDAGIPYELSGLFWLQGSADKERPWKDYGNDLVALFEGFRADLNAADLPIIDTGASGNHNPRTAKAYAASKVDGCNVVVADFPLATQNPDGGQNGELCNSGSGNTCVGVNFQNWPVFEYFGYDPAFGDDKPDGASDKEFYWFKKYPTNNHLEYEGDILQGRSLADVFIQSFTDDQLLSEWIEGDIRIQFPFPVCDPAVNDGKPSFDNICWVDYREPEDLAEATCSMNGMRKMKSIDDMESKQFYSSGSVKQILTGAFAVSLWTFSAAALLFNLV